MDTKYATVIADKIEYIKKARKLFEDGNSDKSVDTNIVKKMVSWTNYHYYVKEFEYFPFI